MGKRPVIVDTDPGTDDAIAITMVLASDQLDVLGFTTVAGNVPVHQATRNALSILETLGRSDLGVWEGSDGPSGGVPQYAYHFHGETGLTVDLGQPSKGPMEGSAVESITSAARGHQGALELIALGPLTNVAEALDAEPELPCLVRRIWVMGGAANCPGNVTPHSEFNFYSDPVAADRVLNSGARVTVVGLDVCDRVRIGQDRQVFPDPASLSGRLLDAWLEAHQGEEFSMCDPLAVAAVMDPTLLGFSAGTVRVEIDGERRGRSVFSPSDGQVEVALEVDHDRALSSICSLAG